MLTDEKRKDLFGVGLYQLSERLRMGCNGSGDLPPDHEDIEEYLLERLLEWKYSRREDEETFDNLVKALVKEALHVYRIDAVARRARGVATMEASAKAFLGEDDDLDSGEHDYNTLRARVQS